MILELYPFLPLYNTKGTILINIPKKYSLNPYNNTFKQKYSSVIIIINTLLCLDLLAKKYPNINIIPRKP